MVYTLLVEHAQGMGHSMVAIVTEMVVGQGDTVDVGIVQKVGHLFVAAQVGTYLGYLLALVRNNRVFQVQQAVVESVGNGLEPGKQSVAVACVQKVLGPVLDGQVTGNHQSYHAAKLMKRP